MDIDQIGLDDPESGDENQSDNSESEDPASVVPVSSTVSTSLIQPQSPRVIPKPQNQTKAQPKNTDYNLYFMWTKTKVSSFFGINNGYQPATVINSKPKSSSCFPLVEYLNITDQTDEIDSTNKTESVQNEEEEVIFDRMAMVILSNNSKYELYCSWATEEKPVLLTNNKRILKQLNKNEKKCKTSTTIIISEQSFNNIFNFCLKNQNVKLSIPLMALFTGSIESFVRGKLENTAEKNIIKSMLEITKLKPERKKLIRTTHPTEDSDNSVGENEEFVEKKDETFFQEISTIHFETSYPGHFFTYLFLLSGFIDRKTFKENKKWGLGSPNNCLKVTLG